MAKSTKTTKAAAAKTTKPTAAKKPVAKAAPKTAPKAKAAPKVASKAKLNVKASAKPSVANAAEKLVKSCQEASVKFEQMDGSEYTEIKEKLDWCVGSYDYDKNPSGLKEYGAKAADILKEVKKDKPRQVSQKLIDDLEKSIASL